MPLKTRKKDVILRDCKAMMQYVLIPKNPVNDIKLKGVKEIVLEPLMTDEEMSKREGTYFEEKEVKTIFNEDVDVYTNENGKKILLARFRKNVLNHDLLEDAWCALYKTAAPSRNRGAAAGPILKTSEYWKKRNPTEIQGWSARYIQNGKVSKMRVNNNVFSSVLGYFDATPFMGLPCRLTSYTQKYFKEYKAGIPYLKAIDQCFKMLTPEAHAKQLKRARDNKAFQIDDTAFSSVTVNRNFRTALHKDAGDYTEGFGNLSVLEYGDYSGGYTLFPRFGIGFNIRTGDFIAMNVHEWHCNTDMYETPAQKKYNAQLPQIFVNNKTTGTFGQDKPYTRISFVCYLREKLLNCKVSETKKYYSRIGFDINKGFKHVNNTTRKKKVTKAGVTEE